MIGIVKCLLIFFVKLFGIVLSINVIVLVCFIFFVFKISCFVVFFVVFCNLYFIMLIF